MQCSFSLNSFGISPSASSPGVGVWVVVRSLSHQRKKKRSLESIWGCSSPATYCQPAAAAGFIYCRSQEWALHSPSPTGFVYLEFSWTHAPFVFSNIQPYPPAAIAVLFYLEFTWGGPPPPLSSGACHTLAAVGCLLLSKHTGGGGTTPAFSSLFIYSSNEGLPLPHSLELRVLCPLWYDFFFQLLIIQFGFFFFFPRAGSVCPGGMPICLREYHVPLICSLGGLPSRVGAGIWQHGIPSCFSV
jgi:hypothetical protein